MEKPITLRPKMVDVEAMQYNGKNGADVVRWILLGDPMAVCEQLAIFHGPRTMPFGMDGSTVATLPAYQYIQFASYHGYDFRVFVGDWVFKHENGNFTRHTHGEVRSKYEPLPDSPPAHTPAQPE